VVAGKTLLHWCAIWGGHQDVVDQLIRVGAPVNACDDDGSTPAHLAAQYGRKELQVKLLEHDCDVHSKNKQGLTCAEVSAKCGTKELMTTGGYFKGGDQVPVEASRVLAMRDSLFFDSSFAPGLRALSRSDDIKSAYREVQWVRIKDLNQDAVEGSTRIGLLGRPWFTAALAACEAGIENLLVGDKSGLSGAYVVRCTNSSGAEEEVLVDDMIPCIDGTPVFTIPGDQRQGELTLVVEKAYAKLNGCYEALLNMSWASASSVDVGPPPTNSTERCIQQVARHAAAGLNSLISSPFGSLLNTGSMQEMASSFAHADRPARQEYVASLAETDCITTVGMRSQVTNPSYLISLKEDCHVSIEAFQSSRKPLLSGGIAVFSDTGASWTHVAAHKVENSKDCCMNTLLTAANSPYVVVPHLGAYPYDVEIAGTKEITVKPLLPDKAQPKKGGWFKG